MNVFDKAPVVDKDAFVAPSASIIGDVQVGRGSSIWYGCVLRGKFNHPDDLCCLTFSFIRIRILSLLLSTVLAICFPSFVAIKQLACNPNFKMMFLMHDDT